MSTNTINPKLTDIKVNDKQTILLGAEQVIVGEKTGTVVKSVEIQPGVFIDKEVDNIEGRVIYDVEKVPHSCWFAIDLETGDRGWFPGAVTYTTVKENTLIYADRSTTSEILITVSNVKVKILDRLDDTNTLKWYNVKYNDLEGFIQIASAGSIIYE